MNSFKLILGRVFATWAILLFVITMFVFIPFIWLAGKQKEPKRTEGFRRISRFWMHIYIPLIGCRLRVKGREHFKKGETYIITCNHNSLMDVPLSTPEIPGPNKTIAKIEMSRIPFFGIPYQIGSILVDRKSEQSRKESYVKMKETLKAGMHVCIYPEGTRNKTREPLQPFKNGAFSLAIETGKPIIPAIITGTKKVLPNHISFFLWPGKMQIKFLPPVSIQPADTVESLREKIFCIMKEEYLSGIRLEYGRMGSGEYELS